MLYPTLEQGDDDNDDHDVILQHERGHHKSSNRSSDRSSNQSQTGTRSQQHSSSSFASTSASASVLPAALRANFDTLEQQSPSKRQRCSDSKALAMETAALVSQQVQRMQESIAELESLLAVQEEEEEELQQQHAVGAAVAAAAGGHLNGNNNNNNNVVFPALPAVVLVYDNPNHRSQVDAEADNRSISSNDDDDDEVPCTLDE
jgi:hypothetical protein